MNPWRHKHFVVVIAFFVLGVMLLQIGSRPVLAGLFNATQEVTYKEYWVSHAEFTGGCGEYDRPNGYSWYIEPSGRYDTSCQKFLDFSIPDNFSNALKAEIYLDLWRNHAQPSARFSINNGPVHAPDVGDPWSRTPYVAEIPLSELNQGTNTIQVWEGGSAFHVHDIAFRIYYDADHPLAPGNNSDVTPPTGQLLTIQDDTGVKQAGDGGNLAIDNDQLVLTASVGADAKFVEFHAFYDGYDEDNDGVSRDWHNRGRNNWFKGGTAAQPLEGTIDHIGTVAVNGAGNYSATWNMPHIPGQSGVRFKIRIVDGAGNVRDAAGGASAVFNLVRTNPVVAFLIPGFQDGILHHDGQFPDVISRYIDLPADVADYDTAYILGSYWKNPKISINDHSQFFAFGEGQDSWTVANKTVPISHLKVGQNKITYYHTSGFGEFVEKPGPMIVLKRTSPVGADTRAPLVHRQNPLPGATYVDSGANVIAYIYDGGTGVDLNTIAMKVNGQTVGPTITGDKYSYRLAYDPPFNFSPGDTVQVKINACDLSGNCMSEASYSFTIKPPAVPATFVSDDFNTCELDSSIWTTYDPKNDATFEIVDAKRVKISVPGGVSHDIWTGGIKAPTIMQASNNGQVDLAAKFDSPMATAVQMQGILIKQDENDFIRVNFQNEGDGTRMMVAGFTNGVIGAKKNGLIGPGLPLYLRVERNELDWTAYYSYDGAEWYRFYDFQHEITVTEVGVFAGNAGATPPAFESVVDFFFNNDSPIDPQDTIGLILPVEVEGNGQVTKDRECGNPVELTAVSDPGWSFDSWLGSVIDGLTDSVVTAAFELNDVVTAIFTRDEYTLEVIKVYNSVDDTEGGSVTLDPEQPFYYYEDEVLVTAVADPGWTFDGWSGALTGATAAQTLTMLQNESVTATFTQDQYEISYDIVGEGSVTIEPDGPYLYGDIVTLTAVPADGYYFASWAGGISSSDNPLEISVTSDLELTVTFTDNQPPTIDPIDDVELMIGEPLTIVVTAADTDGPEPLTFMADGLPPGATFVQTSATTAQLTWLPGCGDNGEHPILFTVSDGMTETYKNVLITVNGYGICTPLILGGPSS